MCAIFVHPINQEVKRETCNVKSPHSTRPAKVQRNAGTVHILDARGHRMYVCNVGTGSETETTQNEIMQSCHVRKIL